MTELITETPSSGSLKAGSQIACRAHAVPLPCRAAKSLECVFPIWFTQCGRVWFTLAMPCPCHALTKATTQHDRLSTAVLCCGLEKSGMVRAWHGHCMTSVNQTRPHCVNQMGKTHSKLLAARHGRGTVWARHAMCESALIVQCGRADGHSWRSCFPQFSKPSKKVKMPFSTPWSHVEGVEA